MDFLVCICNPMGLETHVPVEDINGEEEAVSQAKEMALGTKEGTKIVLFTREGNTMCAWKMTKGGRLRTLAAEEIQGVCAVGPGAFEFAKRQRDKLKNGRGTKREKTSVKDA